MKILKFLFISLFITALMFFMMGVLAESFELSQWPAGLQALFLVSIGVVDLLLVKIYNRA